MTEKWKCFLFFLNCSLIFLLEKLENVSVIMKFRNTETTEIQKSEMAGKQSMDTEIPGNQKTEMSENLKNKVYFVIYNL